jgi:hypothetical protein
MQNEFEACTVNTDKPFMHAAERKEQFRRKHPRRAFRGYVGVLCRGQYFVMQAGEVGEGGMSLISEIVFDIDSEIVVNFKIPSGAFISLKATVKTCRTQGKICTHGVAFRTVSFDQKRQIRSFVSSRASFEKIIL